MRQLTTLEINRIKLLTEKSVELCLIEPTGTGLEKSIMDATGSVRTYLKANNIHDFELQKQGQESKIQITSFLISSDSLVNSVASLYRPNTKKGDPRIWFKGLGSYSKSNDILGIIAFEGNLYVLNITQLDLHKLIENKISNPLQDLVNEINQISNVISNELLFKLRAIAAKGFVPAMLQADTSIGRTLEHLLGIRMNSSKTPDYKGIELKSARENKGTRNGLFGKTPNWALSKFKTREVPTIGDVPYIRLAEMYLILAEAYANTAGKEADAKAALFTLAVNRDPSYTLSANSGAALLNEILVQRRIEFWGEGFRFYDLKRLNQPLDRTVVPNFVSAAVGGVLQVPAGDDRWQFAIPISELQANPNSAQNP